MVSMSDSEILMARGAGEIGVEEWIGRFLVSPPVALYERPRGSKGRPGEARKRGVREATPTPILTPPLAGPSDSADGGETKTPIKI